MNKTINAFIMAAALSLGVVGQSAAHAQAAPAPAAAAPAEAAASNAAAPAESANAAQASTFEHAKPIEGVGMPKSGQINFQDQVTSTGHFAYKMHTYLLMPVITVIALFVLALMLWVMWRYRRAKNPEASRTSHNTFIEIIWTVLPVLILVVIAIPSIQLLAAQFKPAPKNALTIKVTGYQWYWGYEYPDNGIPEYVSNMLPPEKAKANGEPELLGADNRLVLPVNTPIKLIITGADVIHSFSVPSFWVKEDAVPGRLNERTFTVEKEGVYYGQCSELCGDRHGFMPIAVEVVSAEKFAQWVKSQGGKMAGEAAPAAAAPAAAAPAAAAPAAAESNAAASNAASAKS
ncbi:MAG: cytochrome c oxidase subunit II [Sphingobium sp.]|nr:cytochrome c oxidase subunit II [Sphingobium sp.]